MFQHFAWRAQQRAGLSRGSRAVPGEQGWQGGLGVSSAGWARGEQRPAEGPGCGHGMGSPRCVKSHSLCRSPAVRGLQRLHHKCLGRAEGVPCVHSVRTRKPCQHVAGLSRRHRVLLGLLGPHAPSKCPQNPLRVLCLQSFNDRG